MNNVPPESTDLSKSYEASRANCGAEVIIAKRHTDGPLVTVRVPRRNDRQGTLLLGYALAGQRYIFVCDIPTARLNDADGSSVRLYATISIAAADDTAALRKSS